MKHKLSLLLAIALVLAMLAGCGQTGSSSNNGSQGGNGTAATTEPETLPVSCVPLALGTGPVVGIKADGTVILLGENETLQNKISGWTDIVAVSAGSSHILGLKADGTVLFAVDGDESNYDLSGWTDIVAIENSVGVKADGTVVTLYGNGIHGESLANWTNIVATSTSSMHTVALKADGTVVSTSPEYDDYGQSWVYGWENITAVAAGEAHSVGLKADGTVVATELHNEYYNCGQTNVSDWTDIVAIAAGSRHTVGLKADGTVVAVGDNDNKQCKVADWTDIVAIAAGYNSTLGLKADGTVVATGFSYGALDELADWTDILLPDGSNANTEPEEEKPEETAAPGKVDGLEINTEARGIVKAGVSLSSTEIIIAEQAYTFPIRISELLDNGWYYRDSQAESSVFEAKLEYDVSGYMLWHNGLPGTDNSGLSGVDLERIYNDTDKTQYTQDCLATQIDLYGPLASYCDFVIPGGITRNSTAADVLAVFGNPQNNASFLSGDSGSTSLHYTEHKESGLSFGFLFNEDGSIQIINISAKKAPKPS